MTAATVGALAAAGAKAGRTASGVMKTPLAHVGFHIGPVDVEGNVTPWGIVAAVIGADVAITLYNGHKEQMSKQVYHARAKAYGLYYATLLDMEASGAKQFVSLMEDYQRAKTDRARAEILQRGALLKDAVIRNHERIRETERNLSEKFPELWSLLSALGGMGQKQWTGGSARKNVLLYMEKMKRPKYDAPSPMKALGTALGSLVTDVTSGIKNGWG